MKAFQIPETDDMWVVEVNGSFGFGKTKLKAFLNGLKTFVCRVYITLYLNIRGLR